MAHLYVETSEGFISERYIVRLRANGDDGEWQVSLRTEIRWPRPPLPLMPCVSSGTRMSRLGADEAVYYRGLNPLPRGSSDARWR